MKMEKHAFISDTSMPAIASLLVIDDNMVDQMIYRRIVQRSGLVGTIYQFLSAEDALTYLRKPERQHVDAILLDINMPNMDGFEFLEEVRKDERLHRIVVFVLSTSDTPDDIATAYDQNIAGYIVKDDLGESFVRALDMIESFCRIVELPQ